MKWTHFRFIILLITVSSAVVTFVARTCVNIAIVSMVDSNRTIPSNTSTNNNTESDVSVSPISGESLFLAWDGEPQLRLSSYSDLVSRKYHWDSTEQGLILSSFYWSYMLFMLPIGTVIEYFGEKWVMTFSVVASSMVTILTPAFTDCLIVIIVSRFLLGAVQAGLMPSAFALINNWLPLKDRALGFACLDAGTTVGVMLTFSTSGYLVNYFGWPSIFIASGLLGFIQSLIFVFTVTSRPDHHTLLSGTELNIIKSGGGCKGAKCEDHVKPRATPWLRMFTCPAVLSTAFFKFSVSWTYMVFYTKMPVFLKEIVGLDIQSNGVINALTNLANVASLLATGIISEQMITRSNGRLNRTRVRKFFALFSGFAQAIVVAVIPSFVNSGLATLTVMLSLGTFFNGFQGGSDLPLASEMTVNYPAILYSLMNVISVSSGFIVPMFISSVLKSMPNDPVTAWNIVFYSSAGLSTLSTVIFLIFASAERQSFDYPPDLEDPSSLPHVKDKLAIPMNIVTHTLPDKLVTPL